jgi:hypothetical protein
MRWGLRLHGQSDSASMRLRTRPTVEEECRRAVQYQSSGSILGRVQPGFWRSGPSAVPEELSW